MPPPLPSPLSGAAAVIPNKEVEKKTGCRKSAPV
jgi:hypothetical protein